MIQQDEQFLDAVRRHISKVEGALEVDTGETADSVRQRILMALDEVKPALAAAQKGDHQPLTKLLVEVSARLTANIRTFDELPAQVGNACREKCLLSRMIHCDSAEVAMLAQSESDLIPLHDSIEVIARSVQALDALGDLEKRDALYRRNIRYRLESLRSLLKLGEGDAQKFMTGLISASTVLARS